MKNNSHQDIVMASTYLAISILKQSRMPKMQLKKFLLLQPKHVLDKYLHFTNNYTSKKNDKRKDLVDMIINDTTEDIQVINEITKDEADDIIKSMHQIDLKSPNSRQYKKE